jgi:FkbM family methyltransferase
MTGDDQRVPDRSLVDTLGGIKESILNPLYGRLAELRGDVVTYHGVTLDLEPAVVTRRIKAAIARNHYEIGEKQLLDRYLDRSTPLVELGGGLGFIGAYTDRLLDPGTTHVVVEANERLIPVLEDTRRRNDSAFEIVHAAYAPGRSTATLYTHPHFWSNSTRSSSDAGVEVPATSLRELRERFEFDEFALIVDIEGAEVDLLDELDLVEECCSLLVLELHDTKSEHVDIADDIVALRERLDASSMTLVEADETKRVYRANETG